MSKNSHPIALITDSVANLPPDLAKQHNILVIPQHVIWGTDDFLDEVDITPDEFYARLATDPVHPKTSQPTIKEFVDFINKAQENGAKEAVIITVSNQLSGTLASAHGAQDMVDIPCHIFDSLSASLGQGWQAIAAARVREAGGDAQAMVNAANRIREKLAVIFLVDTLEYLHKGGRVGGAAKLVGTALNLKPQLYIDHTTGRVEPGERTRTRKKALERVYSTFFEQLDTSKPLHIAILQANVSHEAKELADRIQKEHKPVELFIGSLTPVVGVHVGPGTIGLAGYHDD